MKQPHRLNPFVWIGLLIVGITNLGTGPEPGHQSSGVRSKKRHRLNLLIWLGLLVVAAAELGISFLPIPPRTRPVLMLAAVTMATLVALGYMRLLTAPPIARGFAIAGLFWLTVLLGLAMTDPLTRTVYAVIG
jgi:caa(3)-type oxidase subunit IV